MNIQSMPILKNLHVLAGMIEANRKELTPYFLRLIEEGCEDGSIHTEYEKELAEAYFCESEDYITEAEQAQKQPVRICYA